MGIAENPLGLIERENKATSYAGNMGAESEFDEKATPHRLAIFLESPGLEKPKDLESIWRLTK
jgi:hypothetical protein